VSEADSGLEAYHSTCMSAVADTMLAMSSPERSTKGVPYRKRMRDGEDGETLAFCNSSSSGTALKRSHTLATIREIPSSAASSSARLLRHQHQEQGQEQGQEQCGGQSGDGSSSRGGGGGGGGGDVLPVARGHALRRTVSEGRAAAGAGGGQPSRPR
jgi:hypothetical protein